MSRFIKILKFILSHPIGSRKPLSSLYRFFKWQIFSIFKVKNTFYWLSGARLITQKGMHAATGNYYVGLLDFEEMTFLLHFLHEEDLFLDVGANVGTYSILSSKIKAAKTISIEPVPTTFKYLKENITLNNVESIVQTHNIGLADKKGELFFSNTLGTINHVTKNQTNAIKVEVKTLEEITIIDRPSILKIDVEGYEYFVLQGAKKVLQNNLLYAVIIELNSSGLRYGVSDEMIHQLLLSNSFYTYSYEPFSRKLVALDSFRKSNNTIYIRNYSFVKERLITSDAINVRGVLI
ncbi:MAG TPA: FkbM family methyltransferase [Cytophagales bacterium]|jgi:FkbM family methyltransferase|nr:FkbM family methyltransferase [Cytophagales bacterium]